MRTIATEELAGDALNWAVAKCLGVEHRAGILSYSESWASAGPIIDSAKIAIDPNDAVMPMAVIVPKPGSRFQYRQYGPTMLIAAMRCFVDCELGSHVDIPDELVQK
jgi:preprotein translocase subunit Sec61beta